MYFLSFLQELPKILSWMTSRHISMSHLKFQLFLNYWNIVLAEMYAPRCTWTKNFKFLDQCDWLKNNLGISYLSVGVLKNIALADVSAGCWTSGTQIPNFSFLTQCGWFGKILEIFVPYLGNFQKSHLSGRMSTQAQFQEFLAQCVWFREILAIFGNFEKSRKIAENMFVWIFFILDSFNISDKFRFAMLLNV